MANQKCEKQIKELKGFRQQCSCGKITYRVRIEGILQPQICSHCGKRFLRRVEDDAKLF